MGRMIEVILPGILSTVQDAGRRGYRAYGVPKSGALDLYSYMVANYLVGNEAGRACIEVIGGLFRFKVHERVTFAVTGAEVRLKVDGKEMPTWAPVEADAGSTIDIGPPMRGFIVYIAFSGGVDVEPVLGSRSTYLTGRFGGFEGRQLKRGDRLKIGSPMGEPKYVELERPELPALGTVVKVRATMGTHADLFSDEAIETFFGQEYTITPESDRMGYRLKGRPIEYEGGGRVPSFPILEGFVQVPHGGQPIVLLADAQTVGGYPVIASVVPPDVRLVANSRPGMKLKFIRIEPNEAQRLAREWEERLKRFARG